MILSNNQSIKLIGFSESSITQFFYLFISQEFAGDLEIITPEQFEKLNNKKNYSYMVAFTQDQKKRIEIIESIEKQNLDCAIYVHDSAFVMFDRNQTRKHIGAGTIVFPNVMIKHDTSVGKHCIIESQVAVGHHITLGDNCHISVGSIIGGRTTIGKNCSFKMRSTILPKITICNDVELGAVSVFSKSVSKSGKYVGTPARRIGDLEEFDKGKKC